MTAAGFSPPPSPWTLVALISRAPPSTRRRKDTPPSPIRSVARYHRAGAARRLGRRDSHRRLCTTTTATAISVVAAAIPHRPNAARTTGTPSTAAAAAACSPIVICVGARSVDDPFPITWPRVLCVPCVSLSRGIYPTVEKRATGISRHSLDGGGGGRCPYEVLHRRRRCVSSVWLLSMGGVRAYNCVAVGIIFKPFRELSFSDEYPPSLLKKLRKRRQFRVFDFILAPLRDIVINVYTKNVQY